MLKETARWPYDFPLSKDFPQSDQRGSVGGQLLVHDRYQFSLLINFIIHCANFRFLNMIMDKFSEFFSSSFIFFRYINKKAVPAYFAYVGLASPGEAGSWQRESKVSVLDLKDDNKKLP